MIQCYTLVSEHIIHEAFDPGTQSWSTDQSGFGERNDVSSYSHMIFDPKKDPPVKETKTISSYPGEAENSIRIGLPNCCKVMQFCQNNNVKSPILQYGSLRYSVSRHTSAPRRRRLVTR